jgi:AcrR family transcriptional regulator
VGARSSMPRAGLSRPAVVDVAIAVIDDGGARGWDDLTLAAVATRAGVAVPSLYKHVNSLADLRCSVSVRCVNELRAVLTDSALGRSGSEALTGLAAAYRDFGRRWPGRYLATQLGHATARTEGCSDAEALGEASASVVSVVAAVLKGCGVEPERMVDAIRAVRAALHGFVTLELGGGFGMPEDVDESFGYLVLTLDRGLRVGSLPTGESRPTSRTGSVGR